MVGHRRIAATAANCASRDWRRHLRRYMRHDLLSFLAFLVVGSVFPGCTQMHPRSTPRHCTRPLRYRATFIPVHSAVGDSSVGNLWWDSGGMIGGIYEAQPSAVGKADPLSESVDSCYTDNLRIHLCEMAVPAGDL